MRRWPLGRDERGQAVVLLGLALTGMLVVGGLGIDAGLLYVERRHEQVSADAAAWAAAVSLAENWNAGNRSSLARAAALDYAKRNGYDDDGVTNTVTVNIPPQSGTHQTADYAEVIVSVNVKTAFIRILGSSHGTERVQARAVGGIAGPPKDYAIIALAKTGQSTFSMVGNSEVEAEGGGILVNSTGSPALSTTSSTQIEGSVDVVGTASAAGSISGTLTTGAARQADPLAYLAPPSGSGLPTFTAVSATGGTVTLSPGIYPSISASGTADVRLGSGTYIITGGGIGVSGNAVIENDTPSDGIGVFIYNACSGFPGGGGSCGAISQSGNGRTQLVAAGTGTYAGISVWQACADTQAMSIAGGGNSGGFETTGTVYLPCAGVSVAGSKHAELEIDDPGGQLIAATVSTAGNGEIEVEWDGSSKTPDRMPALVE